jgi:hypothetical protein
MARLDPNFQVGPRGTRLSVLLTNGQIYYARLAGITRSAVVLDHVFYVDVSVDPKINQRANKLVNREENDWHGPVRMSIPLDKVELSKSSVSALPWRSRSRTHKARSEFALASKDMGLGHLQE